jgi:inosose dehydratase
MTFSRRSFIKVLAASPLPSALSIEPDRKGLVGTQLYGWGQYYQREGKNLNDHMDEVLSAVRDCGYDYAEGSLDLANPEANAALAHLLKSKNLMPVALYSGARLDLLPDASKAIDQITAAAKVAASNGFSIINCNPDPIGRDKTDQELKTQAENLDKLGRALKDIGITLGVHNHTPEMQNKAREFHHNFETTNPNDVGFCYDVHWVFRGGLTPQQVLPKYGKRVVSWHLRESRDGIWWEDLDKGDVDYDFVAAFAKSHSLPQIFSVELALESGTKITRSCIQNHTRSREFVRKTFGL